MSFDLSTPSFFRVLERSNTGTGPITDTTAFTATVTGSGIQQTITVAVTWNNTLKNPDVSVSSTTDGTAGSADGLKYIRLVYPKVRGSGIPWTLDMAASDSTDRTVAISVTTASANVTYESSLTFPTWEADYNTVTIKIPEPVISGGGGGGGDDYVPITRKVNNKALSTDITLTAADVGAATSDHTHSDYVPTTRKVNNKALSSDITLSASDVGALSSSTSIPSKTSDLTNDSGYITINDVPPGSVASSTTPKMDGTAAVGTETAFARGDHVHPTDTSRQAKITASGMLKGDGAGGVTTAIDGTDYISTHQDISGKLNTNGDGSSVTVAFTTASSRTNITTGGTLATAFGRIAKWFGDLGTMAFKSSVAKTDLAQGVQDSLDLADSALQSFTETDPTVPSWAKTSSKPSYTASEVGALPDSTTIPSKTSDLTNDSGFMTSPNVPYLTCSTAKGTAAKTTTLVSGSFTANDLVTGAQVLVKFTYSNTVADPTLSVNGTTAKSIKRYGTTAPSTSAASSWNAGAVVLFVYDGTYWQMEAWENTTYSAMTTAEIEAGTGTTARNITPANLKLAVQTWETGEANVIESVKVNGTALTPDANKAVDVTVPTNVSDLTNDSGFLTTETDPTVPSWAKASSKPSYTASEVGAVPTTRTVNSKALSSDITLTASDVGALSDSTTIPTKTSQLTNDSNFITINDVPPGSVASSTTPKMDGTAATGSENAFARGDHVHPTDTGRQAKITASGILKGDGNGGVTAATAGTDYIADISGKLNTNGDGSSVTVTFTTASSRSNITTGTTLATAFGKIAKYLGDLGTMAFKSSVAKTDLAQGVQDSLDLADTALQSYTETDPTVPSWAKASSKPSYTASEVGAVPTSRTVNSKALSSNITLTASDVGALPDSTTIPYATSTSPKMDGTAAVGSESTFAKGDHVHPTDTSRQAKITASGMLKGDGAGGVTAAVAGTDYIASHQDISGKLDKAGGTMTGALTLSGAPTSNLHACTKKYVDDICGDVESVLEALL